MNLRQKLALAAAAALGVGCATADRAAAPTAAPAPPSPIVEPETATGMERADDEPGEVLATPPPPGVPAAPLAVPAPVSPETVAPARRQPRVSCGASCGGSCGEPDQDDED